MPAAPPAALPRGQGAAFVVRRRRLQLAAPPAAPQPARQTAAEPACGAAHLPKPAPPHTAAHHPASKGPLAGGAPAGAAGAAGTGNASCPAAGWQAHTLLPDTSAQQPGLASVTPAAESTPPSAYACVAGSLGHTCGACQLAASASAAPDAHSMRISALSFTSRGSTAGSTLATRFSMYSGASQSSRLAPPPPGAHKPCTQGVRAHHASACLMTCQVSWRWDKAF